MHEGSWRDLISKFTKSVNGIFSDERPSMCPTISAINVQLQSHLGRLLPSVRKMFCYKVHVIHRNGNVKANYFQEISDQVSSDVPITWSPESYRGLVRGGGAEVQHILTSCL